MIPRAAVALVVLLIPGAVALGSETLTCSTSSQGIRVCTGPGGYVSREWQWQDRVIGDDSNGVGWVTTPWRDGTITTITPGR